MFTKQDINEFVHIAKIDDAFLIVQKNLDLENDRTDFHIVKHDFELSKEVTELKTAKEALYLLLDLLGVKTYYKHSGLRLAIDVIKEPDNEIAN